MKEENKVYVVYSKAYNSKEWIIERSYMLKSIANELKNNIVNNGRMAKIIIK